MAANLQQGKEDNNAFMACILKVKIHSTEGQKFLTRLAKIQGVSSFRMDKDGTIELSGTVDPTLLLKMLEKAGKHVEVCWWQFGQCYSNLYISPEQKGSSHCSGGGGYGNYGGYDQRYLDYDQYSANRPKPKTLYQSFQKPSASGEKAPTQTAKAVECCRLM